MKYRARLIALVSLLLMNNICCSSDDQKAQAEVGKNRRNLILAGTAFAAAAYGCAHKDQIKDVVAPACGIFISAGVAISRFFSQPVSKETAHRVGNVGALAGAAALGAYARGFQVQTTQAKLVQTAEELQQAKSANAALQDANVAVSTSWARDWMRKEADYERRLAIAAKEKEKSRESLFSVLFGKSQAELNLAIACKVQKDLVQARHKPAAENELLIVAVKKLDVENRRNILARDSYAHALLIQFGICGTIGTQGKRVFTGVDAQEAKIEPRSIRDILADQSKPRAGSLQASSPASPFIGYTPCELR